MQMAAHRIRGVFFVVWLEKIFGHWKNVSLTAVYLLLFFFNENNRKNPFDIIINFLFDWSQAQEKKTIFFYQANVTIVIFLFRLITSDQQLISCLLFDSWRTRRKIEGSISISIFYLDIILTLIFLQRIWNKFFIPTFDLIFYIYIYIYIHIIQFRRAFVFSPFPSFILSFRIHLSLSVTPSPRFRLLTVSVWVILRYPRRNTGLIKLGRRRRRVSTTQASALEFI
jgi:hypothetical protein